MELQDLIGKHKLSGVDFSTETIKEEGWYEENCQVVNFVLDGKTYTAIEDPEDGYRSCMREIKVSNRRVGNMFEPIDVVGKMKAAGTYTNDTIEFIDVITGKVVLEIGTDNWDDYYPYWVANFQPENMCINKETGNKI